MTMYGGTSSRIVQRAFKRDTTVNRLMKYILLPSSYIRINVITSLLFLTLSNFTLISWNGVRM